MNSNKIMEIGGNRYIGFTGVSSLETPQNQVLLNPWGAGKSALRSAPGGAHMNAQNKRERAGARARSRGHSQ